MPEPARIRLGEILTRARGSDWRSTRHRGVRWLPLYLAAETSDDSSGDATVLIAMAPGAGYPAHRHVGAEEVWVLEGGYRDEWGEHVAGDWLRYPAGSVHAPVALGDAELDVGPENPECLLYAVARGGVENLE